MGVGRWLSGVKLKLNALKSIYMLFAAKHASHDQLSLVIDGNIILPSPETLFLDLTLDCRLKWASHVAAKCVSAKRALFTVNNCLRHSWGFDKKRLRFLYSAVVEPIITYGCAVWASFLRTEKGIKRIKSFQRVITLLVTKCFKTASAELLLVQSGM